MKPIVVLFMIMPTLPFVIMLNCKVKLINSIICGHPLIHVLVNIKSHKSTVGGVIY